MAYMELATEKEFYLAAACEEVYVPPSAYVSLKGVAVSGTFLRGVLEKAGVEPQIQVRHRLASHHCTLMYRKPYSPHLCIHRWLRPMPPPMPPLTTRP